MFIVVVARYREYSDHIEKEMYKFLAQSWNPEYIDPSLRAKVESGLRCIPRLRAAQWNPESGIRLESRRGQTGGGGVAVVVAVADRSCRFLW